MTGAIEIALAGRLGAFSLEIDIAAPMRGITVLFGPSGCGKTSILRAIAGLNRLPGRIRIGEEVWQDESRFVPTHRRAVGYVFQEASLFPHLSVRHNLTYGARRTREPTRIRLEEVVGLLGLERLVERDPAHLSGGERQRVAIGRALLSQPRLMLMDEPLSALDRISKDEILPYFEALHAELSIPILYVTHDLSEVERLADHLVILSEGRVAQSGALNEVLARRGSKLLARRDLACVLPGHVVRIDPDGIACVRIEGAELLAVAGDLAVGQAVRVRIAAGDVSIARRKSEATSILNALPVSIAGLERLGEAEMLLRLSLGQGAPLLARISRRSVEALALAEGERVVAQVKGVSLLASR